MRACVYMCNCVGIVIAYVRVYVRADLERVQGQLRQLQSLRGRPAERMPILANLRAYYRKEFIPTFFEHLQEEEVGADGDARPAHYTCDVNAAQPWCHGAFTAQGLHTQPLCYAGLPKPCPSSPCRTRCRC
jgi:hypothetical protein